MTLQVDAGVLGPSSGNRKQGPFKTALEQVVSIEKELLGGAAFYGTTLTIASGSLALVKDFMLFKVDGEGSAADDLANIVTGTSGLRTGMMIGIQSVGPVLTLKHLAGGTGQISLRAGADYALRGTDEIAFLVYLGTTWYQLLVDYTTKLRRQAGFTNWATLTPASNVVTPTNGNILIDSASAVDVNQIARTNHPDLGEFLWVGTANATYARTLKHNQGTNGRLIHNDSNDIVLDSTSKYVVYRAATTGGGSPVLFWQEVARFGFTSGSGGSTVRGVCNLRLTLSSGVPVTTSDVLAATTLYATPFGGNQIGLYDGSAWSVLNTAEMSISLSGLAANSVHDVFVYNNAGTPTLELTAWTNDTTRATSLVLQDGILCRSGALTRRYLGTILITATTGQCEDSLKFRGIDNFYNRIVRPLRCSDSTNTWSYTSATWRPFNNSTVLGVGTVKFIDGIGDKVIDATACGVGDVIGENAIGVGVNSTNTPSGLRGSCGTGTYGGTGIGRFIGFGRLGANNLYPLESSNNTYSPVFYGDNGGTINQSGLFAAIMS